MKKTIATITLAATMMFTATFANAGILVSDRSVPCQNTKTGILVSDRTIEGFVKNIVDLIAGILVSDKSSCGQAQGILVSDRTGILVSD